MILKDNVKKDVSLMNGFPICDKDSLTVLPLYRCKIVHSVLTVYETLSRSSLLTPQESEESLTTEVSLKIKVKDNDSFFSFWTVVSVPPLTSSLSRRLRINCPYKSLRLHSKYSRDTFQRKSYLCLRWVTIVIEALHFTVKGFKMSHHSSL